MNDSPDLGKANNVIVFPKSFTGPPIETAINTETIEQATDDLNTALAERIEETTGFFAEVFMETFNSLGLEHSARLNKDMALIIESTRSLLHRYYLFDEHPLQNIADSFFDDDDKGTVRMIAGNVSIIKKEVESQP